MEISAIMKLKKLSIFVMFLLVISILNITEINSYAGVDDLIALGAGCIAGGFWDKMWGGGNCGAYQAPRNGNCLECTENPLQDCTEYKCKAIGQNCGFVEGQCIDFTKDDTNSPKITNCVKLSRYEEYNGRREAIYEERVCNFGEIIKGKGVVAVLTTSEFAKCKFDIELGKDYDQMQGYFEILDEYSLNHLFKINPGEEATEEAMKKCEEGGCRLFIRCEDVAGNAMKYDYAFVFEVKGAGADITPPRIEFTSAVTGYNMKYGDSVLDFGLLADDVSGIMGCKYSRDEDKEYDDPEMISLDCDRIRPAACTTTLIDILDGQENKFYFKCKDKKGNVNTVGKEVVINGGKELTMSVSIPATLTRTSEIQVNTGGGSDSDAAYCFYKLDSDYILFDNTGGSTHKQSLIFIPFPGNYNVEIGCGDSAGDIVKETKNLHVEAIELKVDLEKVETDNQKVGIIVRTSEGELNGEAECNLFEDNLNHEFGDMSNLGVAELALEDGKKHVFEKDGLENGNYEWVVVCRDLEENENFVLVDFKIDTDDLDMVISPPSGIIDGFNVEVRIETSKGIDNGKSVCKYIPEPDFEDDDRWVEGGWNVEGGEDNIHILNLPDGGDFAQKDNKYYIVCKDKAGKTNVQIVIYSVDLKYNLEIDEFKVDDNINLVTSSINPSFSFITKNGKNEDGEAECSLECDKEDEKIYGSVSKTKINEGYLHSGSLTNLKDGEYLCKITCDDGYLGKEIVDKKIVVKTPDLGIYIISPQGNVEKENLRLIIETSGGMNGDGTSLCYYTKNLVNDFRIGNKMDITRKDVDLVYWAYLVSFNLEPISNTKKGHIKVISNEVNPGENTLYVQCRDSVGKLAPKEGPVKITFNVV